jgi:uracil-DNA glycosylase
MGAAAQKQVLATAGIESGWKQALSPALDAPAMRALEGFLAAEAGAGQAVFPPADDIFNAFSLTPFDRVRVVILGQDPYHGDGQAHGLAFSVPAGVRPPPSLVNIYKEIARDFGGAPPKSGDLTCWAEQGVLLLNATLTVRRDQAGSHQNKGWESFTDAAIAALNDRRSGIVFMLWGAFAQKKAAMIDPTRHLVLTAPHPSPLSAHRGFIGCGHFRAANEYLARHGQEPVDWQCATD